MRVKAIAPFFVIIFILGQGFSTATAEDGFRTGLGNSNQVFTNLDIAQAGSFFSLTVSQGKPARIRVELVDIFANEFGAKQIAPLNSTPYSPDKYINFNEDAGAYIPNGRTQTIKIPFKLKNLAELNRPIIGGLRISLQEIQSGTNDPESRIRINAGIVGTFTYYPVGVVNQGEYKIYPELSVERINISPIKSDSFPLSLIPNFLPLINKGPLKITTEMSNDGNIFLETVSKIEISKSGLFARSDGEVLFEYQGDKILLTPGQKSNNTFSVTDRLIQSNILVDPLPSFGIFRVTVNLKGSIGNQELYNISESKLSIVFPWKTSLIGFFVLAVFFLYRRKSHSQMMRWRLDFFNRRKGSINLFQGMNHTHEKQTDESVEGLIQKAEAKSAKAKVHRRTVATRLTAKEKLNTNRTKTKIVTKEKPVKKTTAIKPKSPAGRKKS